MEEVLEPLSLVVSWKAVEDADRYIVTFTKTNGNSQDGLCKGTVHTATLSVDELNATIAVGDDVKRNITSMLRAYTTYAIIVVAENDELGSSKGSKHVEITTGEISKW